MAVRPVWIRYAIETEKRGLKFYKFCMEEVRNPGARDLFEFLIGEEEHHHKSLTDMLKKSVKDKKELSKVEAEFKKKKLDIPLFNKADLKEFTNPDTQVQDMFNMATQLEEKGIAFYKDLAKKAKKKEAKKLFEKLAKDEKDHKDSIVNLGLRIL